MTDRDIAFWFRSNIGWIYIVLFCAIPVVGWLLMNPLSESFYDLNESFLTIGKLAGLVGFVLYSINMVLTLRKRWLENLFHGLNRVYVAHHITGAIALSFLVFHPLLIALQYIQFGVPASAERAAATLFFQPIDLEGPVTMFQEAVAHNSGIIAFIGMVVLLLLTFYAKLPYQFWLFTHRFLGVAFLFAGLHVIFIDSDVSSSLFLTLYMLGWISIGLFAFVYKTLLGNVFIRRSPYRVENISELPGNTVGIWLKPMGETIDFIPGQFIFIRFLWNDSNGVIDEIHPFSVASEPSADGLVLYIRSLGDFTSSLKNLKPGAVAEIEGAFGKFSYTHFQDAPQVWIAGGIGITPFLSMARSYTTDSPQVDLFYSANTREELLDQATLADYLPNYYPKFGFHAFVTAETNEFMSAKHILDAIPDLRDRHIFICGPPPMMKAMRAQFRAMGIKNSRIHTEEFSMS